MPTVYVIPPEEDPEQPWCFFDAEYPHGVPSDPEAELHEVAHADIVHDATLKPDTPPFHRNFIAEDVVMPRKTTEPRFSLEGDGEDEDYGQDITIRGNEPSDFSEIVEVIKVKRYGDKDDYSSDATPKPQKTSMKRSETFFSKASRAFRSIKNVNRSSHSGQSKLSTKEVRRSQDGASSARSTVSSISSVNDPSLPPKKRSAQRRGSIVLSQIFPSSPTPKRRESSETYTIPSPLPSRRSSASLCSSYSESHPENSENAPHVERAPSPSPSSRMGRRFSVLSLFSKAEQDGQISSSTSGDSLTPSSVSTCSSTSVPPTPDGIPPPVPPKAPVPLLKRIPSFMRKETKVEVTPVINPAVLDTPFDAVGDISFEMRLDSLHFDELTFDADQFQF